jgi:hypothetical protein
MSEDINYEKFYDLDNYLFKDITNFFQLNKYLTGLQFYLILIWKARRAIKPNSQKILNKDKSKTFDEGVKILTHKIYEAKSNLDKIKILFSWEFRMATASAILTVLYPKIFTIYDYRVSEHDKLKIFKSLGNIVEGEKAKEKKAERYLEFVEAVKKLKLGKDVNSLRSKDRYLWGRSFYNSAKRKVEDLNKIN